MAKNSAPEEVSATPTDTAAVNEPTQHSFPTAQTNPGDGEYKIATQELFVGGVRAHMPGDRVPAENVERNGWGGMVANA